MCNFSMASPFAILACPCRWMNFQKISLAIRSPHQSIIIPVTIKSLSTEDPEISRQFSQHSVSYSRQDCLKDGPIQWHHFSVSWQRFTIVKFLAKHGHFSMILDSNAPKLGT